MATAKDELALVLDLMVKRMEVARKEARRMARMASARQRSLRRQQMRSGLLGALALQQTISEAQDEEQCWRGRGDGLWFAAALLRGDRHVVCGGQAGDSASGGLHETAVAVQQALEALEAQQQRLRRPVQPPISTSPAAWLPPVLVQMLKPLVPGALAIHTPPTASGVEQTDQADQANELGAVECGAVHNRRQHRRLAASRVCC